MDRKHLLFVDDLKSQQMSCKDAVRDWNEENAAQDREIILYGAETLAEAEELLKYIRFDAAFVDLKMPDGGKKATSQVGNELTREILFKTGIPIGIISGNLADLDPAWNEHEAIETFFKGEKDIFRKALLWLETKWPMMDVLAASRARVREVSAEVFAERLWPYWSNQMTAPDADPSSLVPMIARQYVWHLSEIIGEPEDGSETWHPLENWICPPKNANKISTGDLFCLGKQLWIVLSPPCDLANSNIADVLLAYCDNAAIKDWEASLRKLKEAETPEAKSKAARFFSPYLNQNAVSQHFLAPLPSDPAKPILVRFNRLKTKPLRELTKVLNKRVATVSAPFATNLTQRFGSYASRTGQPNIDPAHFVCVEAELVPEPIPDQEN